jgi:alcohol dehydrogenase (cytochrome c)
MRTSLILGVALTALSTSALAQAPIAPAPAFTVEQLSEPPAEDWITNGGNLTNQRFSPLDQINQSNIGQVKAEWVARMSSGTGPGNSGEAQILAYEDTLYISNGDNDVFAIDVETGATLWGYDGNPAPQAGSPFGKSSRGVAIGDGKVFSSQLDARLVALDQTTGEVAWSVDVAPWQEGYSITSAPLYYDGMVITGVSGGVMGVRCYLSAYDADTGELIWRFYTVPGPGEFGHETWPQDSDAYTKGGAPIWQTPAVDPELGLIYFSTGNPGPVLNGAVRPGDNLFNNSIVALDVRTGEYRWHFQEIHHDIWDLDAPNPVVLFDAEVDGRMRKGLVQVGKTGFAYILDRETGEPLIGIEERPVPQMAEQATSPTQPFPIGDALVQHQIDIPPEGAPVEADGTLFNQGRIFTPFWTDMRMMRPSPQGGANWPPSSYDPRSNTLYVCLTDRPTTYVIELPLQPKQDNVPYFGGSMGQGLHHDGGAFAALDVTTNRLRWRQSWRDACYNGSVVTAGDLVFVGRSDGRLTALDPSNGRLLWEFMTDAGVNTTVTTFMHEGVQKVVVHAGGSVFGDGARGDGVWMFSLNGTMEPVDPEAVAAAQNAAAATPAPIPDPDHEVNLAQGETLYREACLPCHGATGRGGEGGGAPLTEGVTMETIMTVTHTGRNRMPSFAGIYQPAQLQDIGAYIQQVLAEQ